MYERGIIMEKSKKKNVQASVSRKAICRHDYKNSIQVLCMPVMQGTS